MADYQKRQLAGSVDVGDPGPLPADLVGLADTDLADLSWTYEPLGYHGYGFFPLGSAVPNRISAYQAARENVDRGVDVAATQAVIDASDNEPLKAYFKARSHWYRTDQEIDDARVLFSMSEDDMDQFFIDASRWPA